MPSKPLQNTFNQFLFILVSIILLVEIFVGVTGIGITFDEDVSLSLEQKQLLDKLKTRVISKLPEEYMKSEINLIKWLRTSKFDVDLAESRIIDDITWRKEHRIDTIQSEDFSDMWDDFHYYLEGRDNVGRSFLFLDVKHFDIRRVILQGKGERMLRYVDKVYDEACTLIRKLGEQHQNMTRGHLLINLDGYNTIQQGCLRCIPFLIRMVFSYIDHYPECVDKIILVNSPATIHQLIEIARPLIDDVLRRSIHVYGTNKRVWKKALQEDFDFALLPPVLGGTKIYKGTEDHDDF